MVSGRCLTGLLVAVALTGFTVVVRPQIASAQDAVQAGVSAAVRGDVQLARGDAVGRQLESGDAIFLEDVISSGPDSGMQILLLDETVFTIGPNSAMTIDTFVYDPDTGAGQVAATIVRGAFRFVSGQVAQEDPSQMSVGTPLGTIGIRGTIAGGVVDGNQAEIVLLGPGLNNNTQERAGAITVSNDFGSVDIERTGFSTILRPGVPPTIPTRVEPGRVRQIAPASGDDDESNGEDDEGNESGTDDGTADASGGAGDDDGGQGTSSQGNSSESLQNATSESGQSTAASFGNATAFGQTVSSTNQTSDTANEVANSQSNIARISTISEMNSGVGEFHFSSSGNLSSGGTFSVIADLNFSTRQIGGGNSVVDFNSALTGTIGTGNFSILTNNFSQGIDGNAVFLQDSITTDCASGTGACTASIKLTFYTVDGAPGAGMESDFSISGGGSSDSGSTSVDTNRISGVSQAN